MQDLIKIKSASYKRYEELLKKKQEIIKQGEEYKSLYESIFDSLYKEVQALRLDCVKKRKIISYCKSLTSQGKVVIRKNLDEFVERAMKEYNETLDSLYDTEDTITDKKKKKVDLSEDDSKKIKVVYRKLAKLIHPDVNANLIENPVISDLWNRTCIAYNLQNIEELLELEVLINNYLESTNRKHYDVEVPDINEKILNLNREIYRLTHSNPYQYKYILENREEIEKKQEELKQQINDYIRYSNELDDEIDILDTLIEDD